MSAVFAGYGRHYGLLYRDKPYDAEAAWLLARLGAHGAKPGRILDLGCGAGDHARAFAEAGLAVDGIDMSADMLALAEARLADLPAETAARIRLHPGDARTVRLDGGTIDAVLSLFHVVSYQTTVADLAAVIATAGAHLAPGGLFGFDVWHGPAVLADPPQQRIRRAGDGAVELIRLTEPRHRPEDRAVDVAFTLFVRERGAPSWQAIEEVHTMRYWFPDEIAAALDAGGFDPVESCAWLTGGAPGADTFSVFHLARRR